MANTTLMIVGVTILLLNARFTLAIRWVGLQLKNGDRWQLNLIPGAYVATEIHSPEERAYSVGVMWFGINIYALVS